MNESGPSRPERDTAGRFLPGNITSRRGGNPRLRQLAAAQTAVREAATPEQVVEVLNALRTQALAGDVQAGRTWLERVLGRPREEPAGTTVALGPLDTAQGFAEAQRAIAAAASCGELDIADAERLSKILRECSDATVLAEVTRRVEELER